MVKNPDGTVSLSTAEWGWLIDNFDAERQYSEAEVIEAMQAELVMNKQQLTLREKEKALRDSIAMPTVEDWTLNAADNDDLVPRLNQVLLDALREAKNGTLKTWGEIGDSIYRRIGEIAEQHPNAGIVDSEGMSTIARFFAVNFDPVSYNYLRYYLANRSSH